MSSKPEMNESSQTPKDDFYWKESPLPGSESTGMHNGLAAGSNTFSIHILTDLVLPLIYSHFYFWPVFWGSMIFLMPIPNALDFLWIPIVLATLATIVGGAYYGNWLGQRFTNVAYIVPEADRESTVDKGQRNQMLMTVFQAILFPSVFWGGCAVFVGIPSGPPTPSVSLGQLFVVCCNSTMIDQLEIIARFK